MARFDHNATSVADSYANTLLELTEQAGRSDAVLEEFKAFAALLDAEPSFGVFMTNPAIDVDRRRAVLEKHFRGKMDDLLLSAIQVINRKERCELIPLICERYRLALENARNEIDVHVTSAVALSGELRDAIGKAATAVAGKTAKLIEEVDPAILGGLVVRIGDQKLDGSVSRRLRNLRDEMSRRAADELVSGKAYVETAS